MIISSIDLFFKRDWAGGLGPVVDVPRLVVVLEASSSDVAATGRLAGCAVVFEAAPPNIEVVGAAVEAGAAEDDEVATGSTGLKLENTLCVCGNDDPADVGDVTV